MKRINCLFLAYILLGITVSKLVAQKSPAKLIWSEEFNVDGLPDPAIWRYEEGFRRNKEDQFYTSRKENCRIENGMLVLEARREQIPNPEFKAGSENWRESRAQSEYTSASIYSLDRKHIQYGRIEIRAHIPGGKGVWPALWMMGINHDTVGNPACGEIDIMEYVGKDSSHVYGTAHFKPPHSKWKKDRDHKASGGKLTLVPYHDFHVYGVDWTDKRIRFFVDGKVYHSFNVDKAGKGEENAFRQPFYFLINFAMGGNWGGEIDPSNYPKQMLIDYIRVYENQQ